MRQPILVRFTWILCTWKISPLTDTDIASKFLESLWLLHCTWSMQCFKGRSRLYSKKLHSQLKHKLMFWNWAPLVLPWGQNNADVSPIVLGSLDDVITSSVGSSFELFSAPHSRFINYIIFYFFGVLLMHVRSVIDSLLRYCLFFFLISFFLLDLLGFLHRGMVYDWAESLHRVLW